MDQVIVVEEDLNMTELLSDQLKKFAGIETIPRNNAIDTIELLKLLPKINLIITRAKIGDEDTAKKLLDFINKNNLPTNLIVTGVNEFSAQDITIVKNEKNWEDILYYSLQSLNISTESIQKTSSEYISFPIEYLWPLKNLPCSVYLKLNKGPSKFYYLKRYHKSRPITSDSISNYINEGVKVLYILREDERYFSNFISDSYINELAKDGENFEATIDLLFIADTFLRRQIINFGLVKNAIQLGYKIQQKILSLLAEHPLFPDINNYLKRTNLPYTFQNQIILAGIISKLTNENFGEMKKHKDPLIEACFLHSMALGTRDDMAIIYSMDELEKSSLSFDDQLQVMNHASDGADISHKRQDLLFGADQIIREHHGAVNGVGFPRPPFPKIKKASHFFMICDLFARAIYLEKPEELEGKFDDDFSPQIIKRLMKMWRN
ncbi:MAG: hypothetical protein DRQ88_03790 [Epsilonproteobacteria bacterium]|nr:MAG: hypothetical protein DRQ89_04095 [Campylobacterota bacterium]RLA67160.1 MAG: hypothetical protein DRQ88_03790 [Campylobacterota bacterium]